MKKVRLLLLLVVLSMVPAACTSPLGLDCTEATCHDPEGGNHDPEGGNHDPEGGN